MLATGWILYQHYTSHTPMPLEYKSALGPEECSGKPSPEDIDWIHLIWFAYNCSDSQLSDSEIRLSPVSEEIHLWNGVESNLAILNLAVLVGEMWTNLLAELTNGSERENVSNWFKSLLTLDCYPGPPLTVPPLSWWWKRRKLTFTPPLNFSSFLLY